MIAVFLLDKAFLDNGNYKIKFAIDRYEKKRLKRYHIETYKSNIGEHIIEGDVLELKKEDIPQVDLVVGGVPCTKFSLMNTKDNFRKAKEEEYKPLEQFINIVKWSGAKGFLIENVKGFITAKGGVLLDRVKERLHDFNIMYKIINSKDLGSAQSRERVFILGFKDIIPSLELPKLHITRTVRDVFKNIENAPQQDLYLGLKGKYLEMAKHVPPGGNGKDVPVELRPNRKFDNFIQRLDLDSHANTITGLDTEYILHPTENRKLSVREVCRIFGMPDDFILKGSNTSIFTQLKNGVDYHVGKFLANTIYNQMVFTK